MGTETPLTARQLQLLADSTLYGVHVCADDILSVADLLARGLVVAHDSYEGPEVYATDLGKAEAIRRRAVVYGTEDWQRCLVHGPGYPTINQGR